MHKTFYLLVLLKIIILFSFNIILKSSSFSGSIFHSNKFAVILKEAASAGLFP